MGFLVQCTHDERLDITIRPAALIDFVIRSSDKQFSKAKRGFAKRCKKRHRFARHSTDVILSFARFTYKVQFLNRWL